MAGLVVLVFVAIALWFARNWHHDQKLRAAGRRPLSARGDSTPLTSRTSMRHPSEAYIMDTIPVTARSPQTARGIGPQWKDSKPSSEPVDLQKKVMIEESHDVAPHSEEVEESMNIDH